MSDLTYRDFAENIGVPVGTIKRWVHEGMPTRRMGPRVVVNEESARRWIAERGRKIGQRKGWVYFARADDGLIKIGFTSDLPRRMAELGTIHLASFEASMGLERALHRAFAGDHDHDEWFRPSTVLIAFINTLSEAAA